MRRAAGFALTLALMGVGYVRADARVHVVSAGDTLGRLAQRYQVEVDELRAWNELTGDTIRVGQSLTVEHARIIRYRVVPGDTLACIAQRHGVPVRRLRADNPHASRLEVGRRLRIVGGVDPRDTELGTGRAETITYPIAPGDTLTRIARRYDVSAQQITAWNPGLNPDRIRAGSELRIERPGSSESVGAPWCGHIVGSQRLTPHDAFVLRDASRSWATRRTIRRLREGFDRVQRRFPRGPRPRVHDLSLEGGGPIDDHRSHQSGRDVDITYYRRRGCSAEAGCPLERIEPAELDARRQWVLFRTWLQRGYAEAIYVDYGLQRTLYREARRRGASPGELRDWFQYPRGRRDREGLIRHFPNHRDHFHVRFACNEEEPRCR